MLVSEAALAGRLQGKGTSASLFLGGEGVFASFLQDGVALFTLLFGGGALAGLFLGSAVNGLGSDVVSLRGIGW